MISSSRFSFIWIWTWWDYWKFNLYFSTIKIFNNCAIINFRDDHLTLNFYCISGKNITMKIFLHKSIYFYFYSLPHWRMISVIIIGPKIALQETVSLNRLHIFLLASEISLLNFSILFFQIEIKNVWKKYPFPKQIVLEGRIPNCYLINDIPSGMINKKLLIKLIKGSRVKFQKFVLTGSKRQRKQYLTP